METFVNLMIISLHVIKFTKNKEKIEILSFPMFSGVSEISLKIKSNAAYRFISLKCI